MAVITSAGAHKEILRDTEWKACGGWAFDATGYCRSARGTLAKRGVSQGMSVKHRKKPLPERVDGRSIKLCYPIQ